MKAKLSRKLSPRAKKLYLRAAAGDQATFLLQVSAACSKEQLCADIKALGGECRSFSNEAGLLTVEFEAAKLDQLAELDGIVYIEPASVYSH